MNLKKATACLLLVVLVFAMLSTSALAIDQRGYRAGEQILVTDPLSSPPKLKIYKNGQVVDAKSADWIENGVHGQAIKLSGAGDYLEYEDDQLFKSTVTIAGWVNWMGSPDGSVDGAYNQQLFTVYRDDANYLSVNLHAYRDKAKIVEGGTVYRVDGVYLEYQLSGSTGKHVEDFDYTTGGIQYAIPVNQWTHFALIFDDAGVALYINGVQHFSKTIPSGVKDLNAGKLKIGAPLNFSPTLYGAIDDVAIFSERLPVDYLRALADGCSLDFSDVTEKTNYVPTRPSEAETSSDSSEEDGLLGGIPNFAFYLVGLILVVFVVLVIVVNKHEQKEQLSKESEDSTSSEESSERSVPVQSKQPVKQTPVKLTQPTKQVPAQPTKQVPAQPVKQAPAQPVKQAPAQPAKQALAQPVKQAPAQPVKQAPAQPVKQAPAQPVKQAPASPVKQAPAQPIKQAPAQPVKQEPAQPVKQAPAQPVKQAPPQPVKQAPTQTVKQMSPQNEPTTKTETILKPSNQLQTSKPEKGKESGHGAKHFSNTKVKKEKKGRGVYHAKH